MKNAAIFFGSMIVVGGMALAFVILLQGLDRF